MAAVDQLKLKYDQDKFEVVYLDAKSPISFRLEDKHVVNEHLVVQKSHGCSQKTVPTRCNSMYQVISLKQTRSIKKVTLKAAKNYRCPGLLGRASM